MRFLDLLELGGVFEFLVVLVERVAAGAQAVARGGGAIAERAADETLFDRALFRGVGENAGVGQDDAADADNVDMPVAEIVLRDVREIFLQVGVAGADEDELGELGFEFLHDIDLARDGDERIFVRLVTVRGRVRGGTLDVGIVVGAARGEVDELDVEVLQELEELECLGQIGLHGIILVDAKLIFVRQELREILGHAGTEFAGFGEFGIRLERDDVERAEAHAETELRGDGADCGGDFADEAGAVLERAAVLTRAGECAEEFMQQVAVAMLDVDEIGAAIGGDLRGLGVVLDETFQVVIGQNLLAAGDVEFLVEDRVMVRNTGLPLLLVVGTAEAAGVGELETDDEVVGLAEAFVVRLDQRVAQ